MKLSVYISVMTHYYYSLPIFDCYTHNVLAVVVSVVVEKEKRGMSGRMRTIYPCVSNKGLSLEFQEGY